MLTRAARERAARAIYEGNRHSISHDSGFTDRVFNRVFNNVLTKESVIETEDFDLGNYPRDYTRTVDLNKPGLIFVNCHLHPNMAAAILGSPNPWSTKADGAGRFTLREVPAASYTAAAWHRAAGFFRQTVRVGKDQNAGLEFIIPLDAVSAQFPSLANPRNVLQGTGKNARQIRHLKATCKKRFRP